jgi:hypothetical protein
MARTASKSIGSSPNQHHSAHKSGITFLIFSHVRLLASSSRNSFPIASTSIAQGCQLTALFLKRGSHEVRLS